MIKITAKQTVLVKKTSARTRRAARRAVKPYVDRISKVEETGSSFRFVQRPVSCFVKGSYRTAMLPNGVSFIYGVLKRGAQNRKACKP